MYAPRVLNITWGFCEFEVVPPWYATVLGEKDQVQPFGVRLVKSVNVTVCNVLGVVLFAEKSAANMVGPLNPSDENKPRPWVAAITSLSEVLICNMSTLTFANPELEVVQLGEPAFNPVVVQTPTSVATITSL